MLNFWNSCQAKTGISTTICWGNVSADSPSFKYYWLSDNIYLEGFHGSLFLKTSTSPPTFMVTFATSSSPITRSSWAPTTPTLPESSEFSERLLPLTPCRQITKFTREWSTSFDRFRSDKNIAFSTTANHLIALSCSYFFVLHFSTINPCHQSPNKFRYCL